MRTSNEIVVPLNRSLDQIEGFSKEKDLDLGVLVKSDVAEEEDEVMDVVMREDVERVKGYPKLGVGRSMFKVVFL